MTAPRWDSKVASEVFRKLREISSGVIKDTHSLRDAAQTLAAAAEQDENPAIVKAANELAALASVIDSETFNLHELHTLLALLDLDDVRQRLGVPYQATKKRPADKPKAPRPESITQELKRAQTK